MAHNDNNKTLSIVLKALGIILIIGFIIYVTGCATNLWSAPKIHNLSTCPFVIVCTGISLFLLGIVFRHKNSLDDTGLKSLKGLKILFICSLILFLVDLLMLNPVSIDLGSPVNVLFGSILGMTATLAYRAKKSDE